jgi:hypothetical protein
VGAHRRQCIAPHALAGLAHQVGEGVQRDELARGEEVGKRSHAVVWRLEIARVIRQFYFRSPLRLGLPCNRLVFGRRRKVDPPALAFSDDRHQPRAHAPGLAL